MNSDGFTRDAHPLALTNGVEGCYNNNPVIIVFVWVAWQFHHFLREMTLFRSKLAQQVHLTLITQILQAYYTLTIIQTFLCFLFVQFLPKNNNFID